MKTEKINKTKTQRKCFITGEIKSVDELLRFDFDKKNNIISLDIKNIKKGRGAYFVPTIKNWEQIVKTKGLNRVFRTQVSRETYNQITQELEETKCLKKE